MARLLEACRQATGTTATLRWVDPEPILAAGVRPWTDLPIWVPPEHPFHGMHLTDTAKARSAGLRCRPVDQTVADTWAWMRAGGTVGVDRPGVGLAPEVETALLRQAGGG